MQSEPIKKLEAFANANKQTQGKFTIGDEKVGFRSTRLYTVTDNTALSASQRLHET